MLFRVLYKNALWQKKICCNLWYVKMFFNCVLDLDFYNSIFINLSLPLRCGLVICKAGIIYHDICGSVSSHLYQIMFPSKPSYIHMCNCILVKSMYIQKCNINWLPLVTVGSVGIMETQ